MDVKLPDGTVIQGVPDGTSKADLVAKLKSNGMAVPSEWMQTAPQQSQPGIIGTAKQGLGNIAAGAIRGAGSIGATLLYPIDKIGDFIDQGGFGDKVSSQSLSDLVKGGNQPKLTRNEQRRADMDSALQSLGADTNSLAFKGGKLAGEIAGTAGAGGVVANGLRAVPMVAKVAPGLADAVASGGFSGGGNALVRAAGGAINGAATAGLADPENATTGAIIGAALPGVVKVAGMAGNALKEAGEGASKKLMQSAIKPTIAQLKSGDAEIAVQTLLDRGISPTREGVEKIRSLIDDINGQVSNAIQSSGATVSKNKILQALGDVRVKFSNQVSPTSDLNAIDAVAQDFAAHPSIPGNDIPVQLAQQMKQGTYSVLAKKYGQIGNAETEAQKGLARGLKEEIAAAVPEVGPLNAEESKLITTLGVAERRALMELNKNPVGLTALAHNPVAAAGFLADRSAAFKALAARMINRAAQSNAPSQLLVGAAQNPLIRAAGLTATEASP